MAPPCPCLVLRGVQPQHKAQVRFNPEMKFGPAPGDAPNFRLTVAVPLLTVSTAAPGWAQPLELAGVPGAGSCSSVASPEMPNAPAPAACWFASPVT